MFSLFESKHLFNIVVDEKHTSKTIIQLATFAYVKCQNDIQIKPCEKAEKSKLFKCKFNLVLYCSDYRLLLFQFGFNDLLTTKDQNEEEKKKTFWRHFAIPLDWRKGHIIAMCMDNTGTCILAITNNSIIYQIPLSFKCYHDSILSCNRIVIDQDVNLIKSCSLKDPTALTWWQRDLRFIIEKCSVAIVGSKSGCIAMIDLNNDYEFRKYSVSFEISSLSIYSEMYNTSLLITCYQGFQYHLVLEEFKNFQQTQSFLPENSKNSTPTSKNNVSNYSQDSLMNNFNNYYLSCLLNLPMDNEQDLLAKTVCDSNDKNKINDDSTGVKPQLITFNNEMDMISLIGGNKSTGDIKNAAMIANEFFFFTDDFNSNASLTSSRFTIHPQTESTNIYIIKYQNSKMKLSEDLSSSPTSINFGHESNDSINSLNSEDSNEFFLVKKSDFCNISICRDQLLEIYEYQSSKFCTKTILLSSAKLFHISINQLNLNDDMQTEPKLIRLIDCNYRFLMLVFVDRCLLVSKIFSEQNKSSTSSPRSPLLLKRNDSLNHRKSSTAGSFRRKNPSANSMPTMSIIGEFRFDQNSDEIVDVFVLNRGSTCFGIKDYLQDKLSNKTDLDGSNFEKELLEILSNTDLNDDSGINIDEQFLVVTKHSVYLIESKEKSFGKFFHSEIEFYLKKIDSNEIGYQDGDIISRAKLMVDCFAESKSQNCILNKSDQSKLPLFIPNQSWQLWLVRSGLIFMNAIYAHPIIQHLSTVSKTQILSLEKASVDDIEIGEVMKWINNQIRQFYRLLELSRCSRRRVIIALNLYQFWTRSIRQLQKFFKSRILFELNNDERTCLSGYLFDSLMSIHKFYSTNDCLYKNNKNNSEMNLYKYLFEYRHYYNSEHILQKLLEFNLFDMAEYLALLTGNYLHLIKFILRNHYYRINELILSEKIKEKIFRILTSKHVTYALILSTDYLDESRSVSLIETYLQFLFDNLAQMNESILRRLSAVFDPKRLSVRLLLNQTLFYCNQTYLSKQNSFTKYDYFDFCDVTSEFLSTKDLETSLITANGKLRKTLLPIKRRDLINLFLFVKLLYLRKISHRSKISFYQWSFIETVTEWMPNHLKIYNSSIKNLAKFSVDTTRDPYTDWCIAAGTYCSLAYNVEYFYLWGKFDYTYSNSEIFFQNSSTHFTGNFSTKKLKTPTLNRFFSTVINAPIKLISIGHEHLMILTKFGLYGLGSSSYGQLGLGSKILFSRYPILLDFSIRIQKVVCGSYHTLALADNGYLYSFGWSLYGQLGHGLTEDEFSPKLIRYFLDVAKATVVDMDAGYAHSAVLTSIGELYVFGQNTYGQLGIGSNLSENGTFNQTKYSIPQKFSLVEGTVRLICCGLFHTVIIICSSKQNEILLCWGLDPKTCRQKMRLDRTAMANSISGKNFKQYDKTMENPKTFADYTKIRQINLSKLPKKSIIIKMSAGQSHTLLLTDQGQLFGFGYGQEGQLGSPAQSFNTVAASLEATPIMENDQLKFIDIACGAIHSLALDSEGNIFGWGYSNQCQLMCDDCCAEKNNDQLKIEQNQLYNHKFAVKNSPSSNLANQLINNLPKNCKWLPSIIFSLKNQTNIVSEKNIPFDDFTGVKMATEIPSKMTFLESILMTIIYNWHDINLKSLIKRFEQFEFHQLSSFVAWLSKDYSLSFRYQLEALSKENLNNKSKLVSELSKLLLFYISTISTPEFFSQSAQSELTRKILESFISFWKKIDKLNWIEQKDFVKVLKQVYLNHSDNDQWLMNPYFGIQLLCIIRIDQNSNTLRSKLGLDDDNVLIELIQRTKLLIEQSTCDPSVSFQELFDHILNLKSKFKNNQGSVINCSSPTFPLEIKWQQILSTFINAGHNKNSPMQDLSNYSTYDSSQIEIHIPSDIENEDEPLLLLFKCGHYMSKRKFFLSFEQMSNSKVDLNSIKPDLKINYEKLNSIYQNYLSSTASQFDVSWLENELEDLSCLDCCLYSI